MELKLNDRFFDSNGQVYRVRTYTDHWVAFDTWYAKGHEWIMVTNPLRRDELERQLARKEMYLDTPANRILYGKDILIEE